MTNGPADVVRLVAILVLGAALVYSAPAQASDHVAIQVAFSGANLHVEAFCKQCRADVNVVRAGVPVGGGSVTVPPGSEEARTDTAFAIQNGDTVSVSLNGKTLASHVARLPTENSQACGSTTLTGTFDPTTPLLVADAFHNGGSEEVLPSVAGETYVADFTRPFESGGGVSITEAVRDDTELEGSSIDLVTHFTTSSFCGSTDTDGDGIPDSTDQCPAVPGPAPTGCPQQIPVAACDRYWSKPGEPLYVPDPGVLVNDSDPAGLPLSAHVLHISFGAKEHPYSLSPTSGSLLFYPGTSTQPRIATITYDVVNSRGAASAPATISIYIQDRRPTLKQCSHASFDSSSAPSTLMPPEPTPAPKVIVHPKTGSYGDFARVCGATRFNWEDSNGSSLGVKEPHVGCIYAVSNPLARTLLMLAEKTNNSISGALVKLQAYIFGSIKKAHIGPSSEDFTHAKEYYFDKFVDQVSGISEDRALLWAFSNDSEKALEASENVADPTANFISLVQYAAAWVAEDITVSFVRRSITEYNGGMEFITGIEHGHPYLTFAHVLDLPNKYAVFTGEPNVFSGGGHTEHKVNLDLVAHGGVGYVQITSDRLLPSGHFNDVFSAKTTTLVDAGQ